MSFSCNINRHVTAIVEIGRLLKPVSQVRILPGAPLFPQLIDALCDSYEESVRFLVGAWSVSQ